MISFLEKKFSFANFMKTTIQPIKMPLQIFFLMQNFLNKFPQKTISFMV